MRNILMIILTLSLFVSCNESNAPACLKTRGDTVIKTLNLPEFSGITVNQQFIVYIEEADTQSVTLTTGENLTPDISFDVTDGTLEISDNNSCQWVRSYDFPVIHIKHPNLSSIRQNGAGKIISENTINYPNLSLISEYSTGNFEMVLNCDQVKVVSNDLSNFYLSGFVENLRIVFASGDGRFEGQNLVAKKANVFQRGNNDIIVNVTSSLTGRIISYGDVIYVGSKPDIIDVSIENLGKLIDQTN